MYKQFLCIVTLSLVWVATGFSQGSLSGTVVDESTGETLPGVNVVLVETGQGAATDTGGRYSIRQIPSGTYQLQVTFIGYQQLSESITIGEGENTFNISLETESFILNDIVVTALGIRRAERSIGYASQQVRGRELEATREPNVVDALAGRTAGVTIQSSSGQPGSGSRMVIRGNTSMQGNNQPLFVIDGIPVSNDSDGNIQGSTVFTGGATNRALDIDSGNIEDVSILKGASATALYGSRAANGAVIITTRSGQMNQRPTVRFNSSTGWAETYTDGYQSDYLGGNRGFYYNGLPAGRDGYVEQGALEDPFLSNNPQTPWSWGPHKDEVSQQVLQDLGVSRIKTFNPREDFYQTGISLNNSVSLEGGTPGSTYYISAGNLNQTGNVPETSLERTSLMARFGSQLGDRFHVDSSVNYVHTANNWMAEGNGPHTYLFGLNSLPVNFDVNPAKYEDGTQRMNVPYLNNPGWIVENNGFSSDVDRFIANTYVRYDILPWLTVSERIGIDTYTDDRKGKTNIGTRGATPGLYDQVISRSEINSDLTVNANHSLTRDISLDLLAGNNINVRNYKSEEVTGTGLSIPDFFHISNASAVSADQSVSERRLFSFYSQATIDYRDILYLTLTARNDWSSTLPADNNSYFYPSASLGFVFTDVSDLFGGTPLSFGKLRLSVSQIGNDAPVYALATSYTQVRHVDGNRGVINYPFHDVNAYRLQTSLGNPALKPEISTEYELGLDLRFFEGRGRADIAYYDRSTVDQIFNVPTSYATGYGGRLANAGEIRNQGIEITVGATPVQTAEFQWDLDVNYSDNTTEVIEFAPGVENINLGGLSSAQIRIEQGKGGYGVIWGSRYERNEDDQLMIGDNGLPLGAGSLGPIGQVEPDWTANLRSSFSFRGWSLSALFDRRKGGDIMNYDKWYTAYDGSHVSTADRGTEMIFGGIQASTGEVNTTVITRDQNFYQLHYSEFDENFVEDGSYLKLRELSLSYTLPQSLIVHTPFQSLTFTGTGRNLWISSDFSYKDPEGNLLGTGNAQGFYHMVTPATRNFSLSLNASF